MKICIFNFNLSYARAKDNYFTKSIFLWSSLDFSVRGPDCIILSNGEHTNVPSRLSIYKSGTLSRMIANRFCIRWPRRRYYLGDIRFARPSRKSSLYTATINLWNAFYFILSSSFGILKVLYTGTHVLYDVPRRVSFGRWLFSQSIFSKLFPRTTTLLLWYCVSMEIN